MLGPSASNQFLVTKKIGGNYSGFWRKIDAEDLGTGAVGSGNKYLADDMTWKTVSSGLSSITFTSPLTGGTITTTGTVGITQSGISTDGYLSSIDWNTFNNKQSQITLTTTGSSGSASFISNTLNIPTYTLSGLGGVPTSRTLTINGTAFDLSADRSWTLATGLTNWTEAFSSATQATSSLTATNAATNVNAAIVPKGNGAIVAAIPDGTSVGGNARGVYAVDLQISRTANTQVASGEYSAIGGGISNSVAAKRSVIAGGNSNSCPSGSQFYCFIGAGNGNIVNNDGGVVCGGFGNRAGQGAGFTHGYSFVGSGEGNYVYTDRGGIVCGQSNLVSGSKGFIGGGQSNTASGQWSTVAGGRSNGSTNSYTTVCGGYNNQATFTYDTICGGDSNSLTGTNNSQNRFIGGGAQNGINAEQTNGSLIVGGLSNKIFRGAGSFIVGGGWGNGGVPNMVAATSSGILGGAKNNIGRTSPALYPTGSLIGIGEANKILSDASTIVNASFSQVDEGKHYGYIENGQYVNTTLHGQKARNSGSFANVLGDNQVHELIWRRAVTGTAITELFLDGASIAAVLPGTNSVWNGIIDITSICTVTGDGTTVVGHVSATAYKVTIKRIGTTTSLVGGVQEIGITNADASMSTAVFTIDNNDTNESLRVRFTPPSTAGSTTVIRAVATFRGTQIKY
jgi:hypothetical protein